MKHLPHMFQRLCIFLLYACVSLFIWGYVYQFLLPKAQSHLCQGWWSYWEKLEKDSLLFLSTGRGKTIVNHFLFFWVCIYSIVWVNRDGNPEWVWVSNALEGIVKKKKRPLYSLGPVCPGGKKRPLKVCILFSLTPLDCGEPWVTILGSAQSKHWDRLAGVWVAHTPSPPWCFSLTTYPKTLCKVPTANPPGRSCTVSAWDSFLLEDGTSETHSMGGAHRSHSKCLERGLRYEGSNRQSCSQLSSFLLLGLHWNLGSSVPSECLSHGEVHLVLSSCQAVGITVRQAWEPCRITTWVPVRTKLLRLWSMVMGCINNH